MLTRLAIKNFKSIGDPGVALELRPLTFLVGPNGSGKSSVLEALALLAQSTFSPILDNVVQPSGKLVQFTSLGDVLYRHDPDSDIAIGLGWYPAPIRPRRVPSLIRSFNFTVKAKGDRITIAAVPPESTIDAVTRWLANNVYLLSAKARANYWNNELGAYVRDTVAKIWHIAELRSSREFIDKWTSRFELKKFWLDGAYEAKYEDLGVYHSVLLTSYGSSQAYPIIVSVADYMENLKELEGPRDILMIEEPEISLHPQAQVDMAELLATAAAEGKQILATTHSTFLLAALSIPVQKGIIPANDIAIYELEKGPNGTTHKQLEVTEKGYIKGGVPSFAKVERDLLREWLATLPEE